MGNFLTAIGAITIAFLLVLVVAVAFGLGTMFLWNTCLVGAIVGVCEIGFWQAVGLNILSGILFKTISSGKNKK